MTKNPKAKETQETENLLHRLEKMNKDDFSAFLNELNEAPTIAEFFRIYMQKHGIGKTDIVNRSGLSRSYAYEILSGDKQNPSRDSIICLCLAARMDFNETQRALRLGGASELYPKVPRDAAIILCINRKEWDVVNLNIFLEEMNLECL